VRSYTNAGVWIDRKFSHISAQAVNSGKEFDIYLGNNTVNPIWFVECKSYSETTPIDADQFVAYLSLIDNFSRLRYVFNDRKRNITEARSKMKAVLQGSQANQIFDQIYPRMAGSLGLGSNRVVARREYNQMVENFDNKLYIFIDVN